MRGILGLLGLLTALLVVGLLVRQPMATGRTSLPVIQQPTTQTEAVPSGTSTVTLPASDAAVPSSGQIEQQFKQALDQAMQPRSQAAETP